MKRRIITKRRRSNKMRKSRRMKGGCGCTGSSTSVSHMNGGFGSASYTSQGIPSQYVTPLNDHSVDLKDQTNMISSRNLPNIFGGKRRRHKRRRITSKKMRGGTVGLSNNVFSSFGTVKGALDSVGLQNNNYVNPAPYIQPAADIKYSLV